MKSTGAKPCPFCKGAPKSELRRLGSTNAASYAVVCSGCRATGPLRPAPVVAIDSWNEPADREPEGALSDEEWAVAEKKLRGKSYV